MRMIKTQKIRWFGHLYRQKNERIRKVMEWKPDGGRRRGCPRTRWHGRVLLDLMMGRISVLRPRYMERDLAQS